MVVAACSASGAAPAGGGASAAASGGSAATAAASSEGGGSAAGGGASAGGGAAGGAGVPDAAAQVKDVCTVMPKDKVKALVPDVGEPVTDAAYHQCTMSNGTTAIQVTLSAGFGEPDPPVPGDAVSGLGQKAWAQEQTVDDTYLVIFLGQDSKGGYQSMFVEYAGHDGKGHRQDAVGIAQAVIDALR